MTSSQTYGEQGVFFNGKRLGTVNSVIHNTSVGRNANVVPSTQPVRHYAQVEPLITDKQIAFVLKLVGERFVTVIAHYAEDNVRLWTRKQASGEIDDLLKLPKLKAPVSSSERKIEARVVSGNIEEGMYKLGNDIFKVQTSKETGHKYAKRLVQGEGKGTFVFAPGMTHKLTADNKMSLEEAKQYGALYGTCCVCGRTLSDPASVAMGIGPICASKF